MVIIPWNVVVANFRATQSLLMSMREQITQLEQYLEDLPPDSLHLLVELTRDLKTDTYTAALSLRLPGNILSSAQAAKDVKQAFDGSLKALAHEVASHGPGAKGRQPSVRFSDQPMSAGAGPQNQGDIVRDVNQRRQREEREQPHR
jgi:ribosome-associated translation inhibitor RaiA